MVVSLLLLVGCASTTIDNNPKAKNDKLYTVKLMEDGRQRDGEYIVDERSGCLYFQIYNDYRHPVYSSNGEVVGCRDNLSAERVEDYFKN